MMLFSLCSCFVYFCEVFVGLFDVESRIVDVFVDPVQEAALLDHDCLQLLVDSIERVDGCHYLHDFFISLLAELLLQGFETFL